MLAVEDTGIFNIRYWHWKDLSKFNRKRKKKRKSFRSILIEKDLNELSSLEKCWNRIKDLMFSIFFPVLERY